MTIEERIEMLEHVLCGTMLHTTSLADSVGNKFLTDCLTRDRDAFAEQIQKNIKEKMMKDKKFGPHKDIEVPAENQYKKKPQNIKVNHTPKKDEWERVDEQ